MKNRERWEIIRQFERLICSGNSYGECCERVNRERGDAGKLLLGHNSLHRYYRRAQREMARMAAKPTDEMRSQSIANRAFAQRLALERTKAIVIDGKIEKVPDPDIASYLKACEAIDSVSGLAEESRLELLRLVLDSYTRDVMEFLREELSDQAELVRVLTKMRGLAITAARALEKGRIVHRNTIPMLAAEAVVIESNGNGHANGAAKT